MQTALLTMMPFSFFSILPVLLAFVVATEAFLQVTTTTKCASLPMPPSRYRYDVIWMQNILDAGYTFQVSSLSSCASRQGQCRQFNSFVPLQAKDKVNAEDSSTTTSTTTATCYSARTKFDKNWLVHYENLKAYKQEHGHWDVPDKRQGLGRWVLGQRQMQKKGTLRGDRQALLEDIGFTWKPSRPIENYKDQWLDQYKALKMYYKKTTGDFSSSSSSSIDDAKLSLWVDTQRKVYKRGKMQSERKELLDKIGFVWDPLDDSWQNKYEELKDFHEQHGHCNLPRDNNQVRLLCEWLKRQRLNRAARLLNPEKEALLNELNVAWEDVREQRWEREWNEKFVQLEQFRQTKGHCRVPGSHRALGRWVRQQRELYTGSILSKEKIKKLDSIEFVWRLRRQSSTRNNELNDKRWLAQYDNLKAFREEHGHCHVNRKSGSLGRWANRQRSLFKQGRLRYDRQKRLDEVGFVWDSATALRDEVWQAGYSELQTFHQRFGHVEVDSTIQQHEAIYYWLRYQRKMHSAGRLTPKREKLLKRLDANILKQ